MKKHTHLFMIGILCSMIVLAGCNNQSAPADTASTSAEPAAEDLKKLSGYWVNDAWWQMLKETNSPKKASALAEIASISIQQDSGKWMAHMSYNWHEGMQYGIQAEGENFKLVDEMTGQEKAHTLTLQPDGSLHVDKVPMVRIGDSETGYAVISATILGGTYTLDGKNTKVLFQPDGKVTGLDKYVQYELLPDYVTDQANADQLMLYTEPDGMPEFFAFKLESGKLSIFPLIEKQEEQIYVTGKLLYQLTKQ